MKIIFVLQVLYVVSHFETPTARNEFYRQELFCAISIVCHWSLMFCKFLVSLVRKYKNQSFPCNYDVVEDRFVEERQRRSGVRPLHGNVLGYME